MDIFHTSTRPHNGKKPLGAARNHASQPSKIISPLGKSAFEFASYLLLMFLPPSVSHRLQRYILLHAEARQKPSFVNTAS